MIPKSEVDSIRERADIVKVISSYGHDLRKAGKSFKCCCPFHQESTPSFDVDPEKRTFHCFGCGTGGDVFKFVMLIDRLSFPAAIKRVAESVGITVQGGSSQPQEQREEKEVFHRFSAPVTVTIEAWKQNAARFQRSSWAREEMRARGISMEVCKDAMIGWLDNGHDICHPENQYIEKPWIGFPYIWDDVVRLVKWRPVFSAGKDFVRRKGMQDCLFIDGPPDQLDDVMLNEGEIDSLTLRMLGLRACSVPSGFQSKLDKGTKDYLLGFRKVYACVDNDEEGRLLLRRLMADLPADRLAVVMIPEQWKDSNGMYVKGYKRDLDDFRGAFMELVRKAQKPSSVAFADVDEAFALYLARLREKQQETFWEWPWPAVQRMAMIAPGQVVTLLSTRSGQGKTSFAMQSCMHNAVKFGRKIGYYTAEVDPVDEMVPILTAQLTETDRNDLRIEDVERARSMCRNADFYLGFDPEAKGWDDVAALMEMAVKRLGIEVFVIDHLDFIIRDADWSKQNALKSLATRWLKQKFARKYGVLVIVLKQTTKQTSRGRHKNQDPDVYDQSGPSTQVDDADHCFMLDRRKREKLSEEDGEDIYEDTTRLILGKSRRKGKGSSVVTLVFRGKYAKFERVKGKAEAGEESEWPVTSSSQNLPYKDN